MSDIADRRSRKKAQMRELIRGVAHRLFDAHGFEAVTVADVARTADVAVQTVFNHFATKEELFFSGRIPLGDGPADAVRTRPAGVSPLTALSEHLAVGAGHFVALQTTPEGRSFTEMVRRSPALAAYEQRVLFEAEQRLSAALAEAWKTDPEPGPATSPVLSHPELAAPLAAALWLAVSRVVVVEQRRIAAPAAELQPAAIAVQALTEGMLGGLRTQLGLGLPEKGQPLERRAG